MCAYMYVIHMYVRYACMYVYMYGWMDGWMHDFLAFERLGDIQVRSTGL